MITYTWKVTKLEVVNEASLQDVAIISYFVCEGVDQDGVKGQAGSDVRLLPPDPANFTNIYDVTSQQAVDWTLAALGESGIIKFENMVEQQIEGQKLPKPEFVELPWMDPAA
jgi:hypothetical protein